VTAYTAEWILPIAGEPVHRGSVSVADGRIVSLGGRVETGAVDLGRAAILPALVNAHTHLELCHLRDTVAPADRFIDWIQTVLARRREYPPDDPRIMSAARAGIEEARASGTGLVGDVSNTLVTVPLLREAGVHARVFHELLGFNAADPVAIVGAARARADEAAGGARVRVSLAPHAPYSVSPGLFDAIRADLDTHPRDVSTVHLAESPEEVRFIADGTGPWRGLLEDLHAWSDAWTPAGASPVAYLDHLGFLDRRVLAVHGVQLGTADLERLRALGVTIVACPRSNRYVGVGSPPLEAFYAAGVGVAFGTDSLASAPDLNMFAELAAARRLAPRVSARRLLAGATRIGANALGFGEELGTIEAGKRALLIAVRLPDAVTDVEEYLLGGVEPDAIAWLDSDETPNS